LRIKSPVNGAEVVVDGRVVGKTPLRKALALKPGTHKVVVRRLGYVSHTETVRLAAGKQTAILADLLPFAGVIDVVANVADAMVLVDGVEFGKAPLKREVDMGERTVTVTAPEHIPFKKVIQAAPGEVYAIKATLSPMGSGQAGAGVNAAALPPLEAPAANEDAAAERAAAARQKPAAMARSSRSKPTTAPAMPGLEAPPPTQAPRHGATQPGVDPAVFDPRVAARVDDPGPWYKQWWFWSAAGAVVVGSVVTTVLLTRGGGDNGGRPRGVWLPGESIQWSLRAAPNSAMP
jgi:hypothetical protein